MFARPDYQYYSSPKQYKLTLLPNKGTEPSSSICSLPVLYYHFPNARARLWASIQWKKCRKCPGLYLTQGVGLGGSLVLPCVNSQCGSHSDCTNLHWKNRRGSTRIKTWSNRMDGMKEGSSKAALGVWGNTTYSIQLALPQWQPLSSLHCNTKF